MTLRKKFENILHDWIDKDYNRYHIAEVLEVEVDELAIGFAEWLGFDNGKEILEIYKKEKGL